MTGDPRHRAYWTFVEEGRTDVYLQRIFDMSTGTAGYRFLDLVENAKQGIPALHLSRTYPRSVGYEQTTESRPWYTKSGRLEFYREEDEFIVAGENLPVHREPIDSTFYEPNMIVAPQHEALRPKGPAAYGVAPSDLSTETRQGRNVVLTWAETKATAHPLAAEGYRFVFHTPKYRHGAHTTPVDTNFAAMLFGPFGDVHRHRHPRPLRLGGLRRRESRRRAGARDRRWRLRLDRLGSLGSALPWLCSGGN